MNEMTYTQVGDYRIPDIELKNTETKPLGVKGEGLTARCFCHELDHLEGVVFTSIADRMLTNEELETGSWMDDEDTEDVAE